MISLRTLGGSRYPALTAPPGPPDPRVRVVPWLRRFGIAGVAIYPKIYVCDGLLSWQLDLLLAHEGKHWQRQKEASPRWVWFARYLFVLPVFWNPTRRQAEVEAFRAEGLPDYQIRKYLRGWPYFLRR